MKPAYAEKQLAYTTLVLVGRKDSAALLGNKRLIDWYKGAYSEEQSLRQDSNNKLAVAQGKAHRRGWVIVLETLGLGLLGYAAVK